MKNRIITVSREFGSGGRTIGKQVAKELEIPCYDNELIQKIASESGLTSITSKTRANTIRADSSRFFPAVRSAIQTRTLSGKLSAK